MGNLTIMAIRGTVDLWDWALNLMFVHGLLWGPAQWQLDDDVNVAVMPDGLVPIKLGFSPPTLTLRSFGSCHVYCGARQSASLFLLFGGSFHPFAWPSAMLRGGIFASIFAP